MPIGPMVAPQVPSALPPKNKKYLWVGVGITVVVLVFIAVYLYITGHQTAATGAVGTAALMAAAAQKTMRDQAATKIKSDAASADALAKTVTDTRVAIDAIPATVQSESEDQLKADGERLFKPTVL